MAWAYTKGMPGRPTEALDKCPYDKNHLVTVTKRMAHVSRCRRQYLMKQLKNEGPIDVFVCQHHSDLEYGPELVYHETLRCQNKDKIRSHQLDISVLRMLKGVPPGFSLDMFSNDPEEYIQMYMGIDLGKVQGQYDYGRAFKIEDIKYPMGTCQLKAEEKAKVLNNELERLKGLQKENDMENDDLEVEHVPHLNRLIKKEFTEINKKN